MEDFSEGGKKGKIADKQGTSTITEEGKKKDNKQKHRSDRQKPHDVYHGGGTIDRGRHHTIRGSHRGSIPMMVLPFSKRFTHPTPSLTI